MLLLILLCVLLLLFNIIFSVSSNKRPRRLFNFEALKCGCYWRVALKRERYLIQVRRIFYSKFENVIFFFQIQHLTAIIIQYSYLLRKGCPYSELFWSVFCSIWTESKLGKMRTRITVVVIYHAVVIHSRTTSFFHYFIFFFIASLFNLVMVIFFVTLFVIFIYGRY